MGIRHRLRPIALAFLALPLLQAAAPPAALPFPRLTADRGSARVQQRKLESGDLKISLEEGHALRILDRGAPAGIYFKGKGRFEFMTKDRMEAASMAYNLEQNLNIAPTKTTESTHFAEDFTELVIYSPGEAQDAGLVREGADLAPAAFEAFLAPLKDSVVAQLEQLSVLQQLNAPATPLRVVLTKGSHGRFLHVIDPAETLTESLSALRKSTLPHDVFNSIPLSERPLGWDRRVPVLPPATLAHVAMKVEASKGLGVRIETQQTFRANQDGVRALALELYSVKWDFNDSAPRARIHRVIRAKGPSGEELAFDHRDGSLLLQLPYPLRSGSTFTVDFLIEGDLLIRPGGDNYWQLGVEPWFPYPPSMSGQDYTLEATIRVPKPFVPIAPGLTLARRAEGEMNELTVKFEKPIQFFVIQAGKYRFTEEKKDGLTIRVATYANEAAEPERLARLSRQIIAFYQKFLGPFPFPEFNIIQMNQWGYGQAPPGTMFITNEAFRRLEDSAMTISSEGGAIEGPSLDRIFSKGVNGRFAHEIAHQYWGHVVKMPNPEEQWITESFSEICAGLVIRQMKGLGPSFFESMVNRWKTRGEMATAASSIACANRLRTTGSGGDASLKRQGLIYDKGAYLLDRIRRDIGDGPFMAFLGNFQASFPWRFGTTSHAVGLLKFMTKRDYRDLFERCYWGTEMPPEKLPSK